jgi:hypothetical protein
VINQEILFPSHVSRRWAENIVSKTSFLACMFPERHDDETFSSAINFKLAWETNYVF